MVVRKEEGGTIYYFGNRSLAAKSGSTVLSKARFADVVIDKNGNTIEKTRLHVQDYIEAYYSLEMLRKTFGKEKINSMIEQAEIVNMLED